MLAIKLTTDYIMGRFTSLDFFGFVDEAWARGSNTDDETAKKLVSGEMKVSETSDKKEVVIAIFSDGKDWVSKTGEIKRKWDSTLGVMVCEIEDRGSIEDLVGVKIPEKDKGKVKQSAPDIEMFFHVFNDGQTMIKEEVLKKMPKGFEEGIEKIRKDNLNKKLAYEEYEENKRGSFEVL